MRRVIILPGFIKLNGSFFIFIGQRIKNSHVTSDFDRHAQFVTVQLHKGRIRHAQIVIRINEHDPEMIIDHIEGNLASADRTVNEGHDDIMRIVQQELVA